MLESRIDNLKMEIADNLCLYRLDKSLAWLFNVESGEYYNLNDTAYFVLTLFDGKKKVSNVRQIYIEEFSKEGIDKTKLLTDFDELLELLLKHKVLNTNKT